MVQPVALLSAPHLKSILFLLFSVLFAALLYLSILVTAYDYSAIIGLEDIVYHEMGYRQMKTALTEGGLRIYKMLIYTSFGFLTLLLLCRQLRVVLADEFQLLRQESVQALRSVKRGISSLSLKQWLIFSAIIGATSVVKLYFLLHYPLHTDETATFDYFVMEGIEAVTAYYPIPNNHVFQNLLNWFSYQLYPDFYFSVRGTSFLISTVGLALLFLLLHVAVNFRTAAAFTLLIGIANMPLYFSITGRGYALLLILAGVGFISAFYILRGKQFPKRLCFLVLTLSSIAGLYTVPTYLYTFATYFVILFAGSLVQRQCTLLPYLAAICGIVGFATLLLYSPIIVVSGAKSLFANSYIASQGTFSVLLALTSYFVSLESSIVGQDRVGYLVSIGVLLVAIWLTRANMLSRDKKLLCLMAITACLLPYIFFLLQGVLPPDRTMSYKSFYFFLLAAIIADTLLASYLRNSRAAASALGIVLVFYFTYQTSVSYRVMGRLQPAENQMLAIWEKVTQQEPASMYIADPFYQLFFLHYAKVSGKEISLYSDFERGKASDILILTPEAHLPQHLPENYTNIYNNSKVKIYQKKL